MNKLLLEPWRTYCICSHLVFHVQNNIFNYFEVGGRRWPCKVTHLTGNQVNFGKYRFVRGCIDILEDEWLTFFPNIASVS